MGPHCLLFMGLSAGLAPWIVTVVKRKLQTCLEIGGSIGNAALVAN